MLGSDALIEAACWITCGVLAVWGCWLWAQAIGIERALRRAGGMQAWKRGKLLGPEDVERGEMSGAWKRDNEVGWREGDK